MKPSLISELQRQRQKRLYEAASARRKHRGTRDAHIKAIHATTLLLRAEVKSQRRGEKKATGPDMFEGLLQ